MSLPYSLKSLKRNDTNTFVIAEIGLNHNGKLDLAYQSIDAAIEAGADAVKFQNYKTEDFVVDRSITHTYFNGSKTVTESQYEMFKRCEVSNDMLAKISDYCRERQIVFLSTPTSSEGINALLKLKVPLLKNGSDYLGNLDLIKDMARTGLPLILSTGMATIAEMDDGVRAFESAGGKELILLQCTSTYPTPDHEVCLNKIPTLRLAFGYPVGFSDHSQGIVACLGAVVMGACILEKHFTLDKKLEGPDHQFSADPEEMKLLCDSIRKLELQLGTSRLGPTESEITNLSGSRLSCVAAMNMQQGTILTDSHIIYHRPGTGIPPKLKHYVIGKKLKTHLEVGQLIQMEDLE